MRGGLLCCYHVSSVFRQLLLQLTQFRLCSRKGGVFFVERVCCEGVLKRVGYEGVSTATCTSCTGDFR